MPDFSLYLFPSCRTAGERARPDGGTALINTNASARARQTPVHFAEYTDGLSATPNLLFNDRKLS